MALTDEEWEHRYFHAPRVIDFICKVKERLDNGTLKNSAELREIADSSLLRRRSKEGNS